MFLPQVQNFFFGLVSIYLSNDFTPFIRACTASIETSKQNSAQHAAAESGLLRAHSFEKVSFTQLSLLSSGDRKRDGARFDAKAIDARTSLPIHFKSGFL
jgi:hypothetical protein